MEAIILIFLRLMIPLAIFGGLAYFLFGPGAKKLARAVAGEHPYLREARAVATRIRANLADADAGLRERCMADIEALLSQRLPKILEQYTRLATHLATVTEAAIETEISAIEARLARSEDAKLKDILHESLALARERSESRRKMQLLADRTEAELKQVLLYLEALESRALSLGISAPQQDLPAEMVSLLEEVSTLETMYRDMDEPAHAAEARPEGEPPTAAGEPDASDAGAGRRRKRAREGGDGR